jgi:hypothetical protein
MGLIPGKNYIDKDQKRHKLILITITPFFQNGVIVIFPKT